MKKAEHDGMRAEYRREDLGKGVRGKYYKNFRRGSNLVLLRPEVAAAFKSEESVNDALMALLDLARKTFKLPHRLHIPT